jgi:hypothetical protein
MVTVPLPQLADFAVLTPVAYARYPPVVAKRLLIPGDNSPYHH